MSDKSSEFNKNKIPTRDEVPQEYTWDLTDLYESDEAWLDDYESAGEMVEKISSYRGRLMSSASTLLEFMKYDDECSIRVNRLANYAMRKNDQDTTVSKYQDFKARCTTCLYA